MSWKDDTWGVGRDKPTEFQLYEMEYVKVYDQVVMGDSCYETYRTLKEAKNELKRMIADGSVELNAGIIFEVDFKNKRYRQVCSNWGEWDNKKQEWQSGTNPQL